MTHLVIHRWFEAFKDKDLSGFEALLAEDAIFYSPVVHSGQQGRALVAKYLRAAMVVLGTPDFRYVEQWVGEHSAVLEFEVSLDGTYVNGVDIMRWNDRNEVVEFKVMIRPMKGLQAVLARMALQLEA